MRARVVFPAPEWPAKKKAVTSKTSVKKETPFVREAGHEKELVERVRNLQQTICRSGPVRVPKSVPRPLAENNAVAAKALVHGRCCVDRRGRWVAKLESHTISLLVNTPVAARIEKDPVRSGRDVFAGVDYHRYISWSIVGTGEVFEIDRQLGF
jgi:hypothetical protein